MVVTTLLTKFCSWWSDLQPGSRSAAWLALVTDSAAGRQQAQAALSHPPRQPFSVCHQRPVSSGSLSESTPGCRCNRTGCSVSVTGAHRSWLWRHPPLHSPGWARNIDSAAGGHDSRGAGLSQQRSSDPGISKVLTIPFLYHSPALTRGTLALYWSGTISL